MTEVSRPVGRPGKYNPELQEKADYYLYNWHEIGDVVPSRAGLCVYLGIAKSTSHEWGEQYPEFSDTLENINVVQESVALNGGLSSTFNSTITKLVLANHGYTDKQEVSHKVTDDGSNEW